MVRGTSVMPRITTSRGGKPYEDPALVYMPRRRTRSEEARESIDSAMQSGSLEHMESVLRSLQNPVDTRNYVVQTRSVHHLERKYKSTLLATSCSAVSALQKHAADRPEIGPKPEDLKTLSVKPDKPQKPEPMILPTLEEALEKARKSCDGDCQEKKGWFIAEEFVEGNHQSEDGSDVRDAILSAILFRCGSWTHKLTVGECVEHLQCPELVDFCMSPKASPVTGESATEFMKKFIKSQEEKTIRVAKLKRELVKHCSSDIANAFEREHASYFDFILAYAACITKLLKFTKVSPGIQQFDVENEDAGSAITAIQGALKIGCSTEYKEEWEQRKKQKDEWEEKHARLLKAAEKYVLRYKNFGSEFDKLSPFLQKADKLGVDRVHVAAFCETLEKDKQEADAWRKNCESSENAAQILNNLKMKYDITVTFAEARKSVFGKQATPQT